MINYPTILPDTSEFLSRPAKMLIGGQWIDASGGGTIDSIDPATGTTLTTFPAGTAEDADASVRAARSAFPEWKRMSPQERGRLLFELALAVEKHEDELSTLPGFLLVNSVVMA